MKIKLFEKMTTQFTKNNEANYHLGITKEEKKLHKTIYRFCIIIGLMISTIISIMIYFQKGTPRDYMIGNTFSIFYIIVIIYLIYKDNIEIIIENNIIYKNSWFVQKKEIGKLEDIKMAYYSLSGKIHVLDEKMKPIFKIEEYGLPDNEKFSQWLKEKIVKTNFYSQGVPQLAYVWYFIAVISIFLPFLAINTQESIGTIIFAISIPIMFFLLGIKEKTMFLWITEENIIVREWFFIKKYPIQKVDKVIYRFLKNENGYSTWKIKAYEKGKKLFGMKRIPEHEIDKLIRKFAKYQIETIRKTDIDI